MKTIEALKKLTLLDWFLAMCVTFVVTGIVLKAVAPDFLHKTIQDRWYHSYADVTVVLDPGYEWLGPNIVPGSGALLDSLDESLKIAEVIGVQVPTEGPFEDRTLVTLRVVLSRTEVGQTIYGRYRLRKGDAFFFDSPDYVFHSRIVSWEMVPDAKLSTRLLDKA